jgi:uncharacterized protein (TIGR00106 family)
LLHQYLGTFLRKKSLNLGINFIKRQSKAIPQINNQQEGIMPIATINVIPLGTATPSVGSYVADCVKVLKDAGANFEMNAMGTVIDGDLDDILMLVKKMHSVPFEKGVKRVVTTVSIDDRRDKKVTSSEKLESLMKRL